MAGDQAREVMEQRSGRRQSVLSGPSTHDGIEALASRVNGFLAALGMPGKTAFHIEFALHEALTNAAFHGNGGDPTKAVTVTCRAEPHEVTLIIDNEGAGFDPGCVPDCRAEVNLLSESGRGVFLMYQFADECRYEKGGRRVVLVKRWP